MHRFSAGLIDWNTLHGIQQDIKLTIINPIMLT